MKKLIKKAGKWLGYALFLRTLRTGVRPDGRRLDSTKMPWTRTRDFSDTELRAVRAYLLSLPQPPALAAH